MIDDNNAGMRARAIWVQRKQHGRDFTYEQLLEAWDWHHKDLVEAFGSNDALASALREVAPTFQEPEAPIQLWRGGVAQRDDHPANVARGLSWTLDYDVACWFAVSAPRLPRLMRDFRPFVFSTAATLHEIITIHEGGTAVTATECEFLLEPAKLDMRKIIVADTSIAVADLKQDTGVPADVFERWNAAAARYHKVRYARLHEVQADTSKAEEGQ